MRFHDEGYGFDLFGLHPPTAQRMLRAVLPLYRHYFSVESQGHENIPADGGAILVANHGGMLPIDAAMLWTDVVLRTGRYVRMIADRLVPRLPIVSTLFARTGVVSGTHANVRRLLDRGEVIAVFPEGITGPAKPFRQRYELQDWRVGHAELAIRHRLPIIPVAIIGAEESWPVLARVHWRMFGAPYLPIPMAPLPLPVTFRIHFDPMINVLSAEDYVRATLLAAESDATGVFNIAGADTLPLSVVARLADRRCLPLPGPLLAPAYGLRRRTIGRDFRYDLNMRRFHFGGILDGTRAARELGYRPATSLWPDVTAAGSLN